MLCLGQEHGLQFLARLGAGHAEAKNSWQETSLAAAPAFLVLNQFCAVISLLHSAVSSSFDCAF